MAGYQQILDAVAPQPDALHYLGIALAQQGRYSEALGPLARAAAIHDDKPAVHNHYGNALAGMKRHGEAMQSYECAIACDPNVADDLATAGGQLAVARGTVRYALVSDSSSVSPDRAG